MSITMRSVAAILLTTAAAACGSSSQASGGLASGSSSRSMTAGGTSAAPASRAVEVSISGFAFRPATINVTPGAKVSFTNHDQTPHTATSNKPGFDSGTIGPGQSATVTLTKAGTYTFYCQFHAFMHGTIVVK